MKIYKDEQELMNTDWQTKIDEAVDVGDLHLAAQYEQARNDKINNPLYTGRQTVTNKYAQHLTSNAEPSAPAAVVGGNSGSAGTKISYPSFDAAAWEAKKPTYVNGYADRIDALLNDVMNREAFSYDADSDPLYQQYQKQYRREGTRAMDDTLAELASSAGGMNSYAVTAAQQANNYYGAQLADRIPELYQLAYEMYMQDYEQDLSALELLQGREADAYGRYQDELADWYAEMEAAYNMSQDAIDNAKEYDDTVYDRAMDQVVLKGQGFTDEELAGLAALATPSYPITGSPAVQPAVPTPAVTPTPAPDPVEPPKKKDVTYDNGSLSEDQIRELQNYYEVDADGKWGKSSTAAAGGQTAEQAWQEYARMMGYTEKPETSRYDEVEDMVKYMAGTNALGRQRSSDEEILAYLDQFSEDELSDEELEKIMSRYHLGS